MAVLMVIVHLSQSFVRLLSALADLPINQSFAVTGSINQHGEAQAIGLVMSTNRNKSNRGIQVLLENQRNQLELLLTAAALARSSEVKLRGLFIEEENLIRAANLPMSREVSRWSAKERHITGDSVHRILNAHASRQQKELEKAIFDGSDASKKALKIAVEIAEKNDKPLRVLLLVDEFTSNELEDQLQAQFSYMLEQELLTDKPGRQTGSETNQTRGRGEVCSQRAIRYSICEGKPLYSTEDALCALNYFGRRASYNKAIEVAEGVRATFIDAGHILGSACIFLELEEEGPKTHCIVLRGFRDPDKPPHADVVVMETTYGDRAHKDLEPSIDELFEAINSTVARGGKYYYSYIRTGKGARASPPNIFSRHPECYDTDTKELFAGGQDPFDFPSLHFTKEASESMALNNIHSGALILAGSGMCTGGRVRHHLKKNIWRKECSVIFVGFAARGTPARRIVDGAKTVVYLR
ncbi:Ribonuclease [Nymphon striatum]|nr:Ribonuclease [Nymphon striatum]